MSDLLASSAEATAWIEQTKAVYSSDTRFGELKGAVIWSDARGPDGCLIVDVDPHALVAQFVETGGLPLLLNHDPGFPLGKLLKAACFTTPTGTTFVAALLGLYSGRRYSFVEFASDPGGEIPLPNKLPVFPTTGRINFATDPKEVAPHWVAEVLRNAPIPVKRSALAHYAADSSQELIRVGILFMALVWNPLVTSIAKEAGRDVYAGIKQWFCTLAGKLAELRNPILEIQSHHNGCQISFLLRGKNVNKHYVAMDMLSATCMRAADLIEGMKSAAAPPKLLVYEFEMNEQKWFPSYAELVDGRFVTDNKILIAVESLPSGISMGLVSSDKVPGK